MSDPKPIVEEDLKEFDIEIVKQSKECVELDVTLENPLIEVPNQ